MSITWKIKTLECCSSNGYGMVVPVVYEQAEAPITTPAVIEAAY
jgi:hypothetical protein